MKVKHVVDFNGKVISREIISNEKTDITPLVLMYADSLYKGEIGYENDED